MRVPAAVSPAGVGPRLVRRRPRHVAVGPLLLLNSRALPLSGGRRGAAVSAHSVDVFVDGATAALRGRRRAGFVEGGALGGLGVAAGRGWRRRARGGRGRHEVEGHAADLQRGVVGVRVHVPLGQLDVVRGTVLKVCYQLLRNKKQEEVLE